MQEILLAEATVNGTIAFRPIETSDVEVKAGEPFRIRYHYKVYEASYQEEAWRFRLTASLVGEDEATSEMVHGDRRVFRDDVWANLHQEHVCPAPGEYALDFVAEAQMSQQPWKDAKPTGTHRREVTGRVHIKAV